MQNPLLARFEELRRERASLSSDSERFLWAERVLPNLAFDERKHSLFNNYLVLSRASGASFPEELIRMFDEAYAELATVSAYSQLKQPSANAGLRPTADGKQGVEVFQLKPSFYGISVDLKALWRGLKARMAGKR
jgi:hypothetical protein